MIYLDNAATTQVRPEVRDAMLPWLSDKYGNPSSHYDIGRQAADAVRKSRETIGRMIGADPDEIFFTSGGSEANSWAIDGLYCIDNGGHLLMSPIEHHSLLNNRHKKEMLSVNEEGVVDLYKLDKQIEFNTPLVAVMMVNNEIGTIQPINAIDAICEQDNVFLHVDAVQAFGHIGIDVRNYHAVSTMSASAHKIGGPKGIGFLYIQRDVQQLYHELIHGGQQEFGKRGGTENVASIVGFAKACEMAQREHDQYFAEYRNIMYDFWYKLQELVPSVSLNGPGWLSEYRVPYILNIKIKDIRAEELIECLNVEGVCVSSGSACNSDDDKPSHVLKAIGLSDEEANSSIRISIGTETTQDDLDRAAQAIANSVKLLSGR